MAGKDLQSMSRDELYEKAKEQNIPNKSSMSKDELISALSGSGSPGSSHSKHSPSQCQSSSASSSSSHSGGHGSSSRS